MIDWCSPDCIPICRPISPIRLFLHIDLVSLAVELDEKHQVPRQECTANQGGIFIARAVAKDWEAWGVLVCEMHVGGEECYKNVEYELGYLYCRDVFLPLLGRVSDAVSKDEEARGLEPRSLLLRRLRNSNSLCNTS